MRDAPRQRISRPGEDGFSLAEVMVAMAMLLVGVLGLLVMIEGSLSSTSRTTAREQATNLARDIVERSRQVPYASTTTSAAPAAIAATLPETPAVTAGTFSVRRRNVDYAVTVSACSIDNPSDGAGVGDTSFCDAPTGSQGPATPATGSGLALGPNILGLPVELAAGGSLVNTLCNAIGTNTAVINALPTASLLSLVGNGAQLQVCPAATGGSMAYDTRPDDLRRIRVRVAWTPHDGPASELTQTTLLTTPG